MNLKHKRFFALIVKFILCAPLLHAQTRIDSSKEKKMISPQLYKNIYFLNPPLPNSIPGNFYAKQLPFFCSKELQVQKLTGFPIKFRLGSVEYCDKLEGKNK